MSRRRGLSVRLGAPAARRVATLLRVGLLMALCALASWPVLALEVGEIELTSPVRQNLRRLQENWQQWLQAYRESDAALAENSLEQILSVADYLGMSKLPDLSTAAASLAVQSAENGDPERARWALEAARRLDPSRPEVEFAAAGVGRLTGNYLGAVSHYIDAMALVLRLPLEGRFARQSLILWGVLTLIWCATGFLLLQMAARGAGLFYDLGRLFSPPLPKAAADAVALVLLLWPLLLPSGLLWLVVYWSILLWGYGSVSERAVYAVLWLALGAVPFAIVHQQREMQAALLPPTRAIENMRAGRFYGNLLTDLDVMRNLVSDGTAVTELIADVHRRFGQWEHARLIYTGLMEDEMPDVHRAAILNNLGVYHHRKGDYGTAINYFKDAAAADAGLVAAHFNLSQAYNQNFEFGLAHQALAQAKSLDAPLVASWEASQGASEGSVVPIDGGLARAEEIFTALDPGSREDTVEQVELRRYLSLAVAVAAFLLAVGLHWMRRQKGYPSRKFKTTRSGPLWMRVAIPGWDSTRRHSGVPAFLALLLPIGLLLIPVTRLWSYRPPLGYDPGITPLVAISSVGLLAFYSIRYLLKRG